MDQNNVHTINSNANNQQLSLPNLLQLLSKLHTEDVSQAQKMLKGHAGSNSQLCSNLVVILKDQNIPLQIRLASALYLNTAISDDHFKFTSQDYFAIATSILQDQTIEPSYKRYLERAIVSLIDRFEQPLITQFRQIIFNMIKSEKLRDTAYLLISCFCIPEEIDKQHIIYLTKMYINQTLSRVVLKNTEESVHLAKQYNQIIKMWIVAWDRLNNKSQQNQKVNKQANKLLFQIAQSEYLITVIVEVYKWMALQPIYICTHEKLYELNVLKQEAAELHIKMLQFLYENAKEVLQNTSTFKLTAQHIKNIINSIMVASNNNQALQKYQCQDFIVNLVKVLKWFICIKPSSFKNEWKQLLKFIVFPLMKPDSQQIYAFQQNPHDYHSLFEDCAQKQLFGILKTEVCNLLQKISDKSEVITQQIFITDFIINFFIDSTKNYWIKQQDNNYAIDYVSLDVSMVGLSIFSYRLDRHKQKMSQLRALFTKQLLYSINQYEKCVVLIFLSYNYGEVYPKPEEGSHWVQFSLQQQSHPSLVHCTNDFLDNIADEYYSDYFFQQMSSKILNNSIATIWDAIQKLIRVHAAKVSSALMLQMIMNIYSRLQMQIERVSTQTIKQTMHIIKLVQIIRSLAQQDNYCKSNPDVIGAIWKVIHAHDKAVSLGFEDQLMHIIYCLVKQEDKISDTSKQVLQIVLNQFAKDQYFGEVYYKIINHYIMKSSSEVIPQIFVSIKSCLLFHQMNMGESIKKSQRRLIFSHVLLLLQNMIAMHGKALTQDFLIQIGAIVIRFVPTQNKGNIDSKVVLARVLNVLLLTHMLIPVQNMWNYLQVFTNDQIFFNYDLKVLITCIKMQIFLEEMIEVKAQMIAILGCAINGFRKRQKADLNAKKIRQKYGKDNKLKVYKYKQYEKILKYMNTPFKLESQSFQKQLSNLLQKIRDSNRQMYIQMTKYISKDHTEIICTLCKFSEGSLLNKRVIYTVLKPKAPEQVLDEKDKEGEMNSDEQQNEQAKRKRLQNKKKKKARQSGAQKMT